METYSMIVDGKMDVNVAISLQKNTSGINRPPL